MSAARNRGARAWRVGVAAAAACALAACGGGAFRESASGGDGGARLTAEDGGAAEDGAAPLDASVDAPSDAARADAAGGSPFACGVTTCDGETEYCLVKGSGANRQASCRALPAACTPSPTCGCVEQQDAPCGSPSCVSPGGDVTITCTGL